MYNFFKILILIKNKKFDNLNQDSSEPSKNLKLLENIKFDSISSLFLKKNSNIMNYQYRFKRNFNYFYSFRFNNNPAYSFSKNVKFEALAKKNIIKLNDKINLLLTLKFLSHVSFFFFKKNIALSNIFKFKKLNFFFLDNVKFILFYLNLYFKNSTIILIYNYLNSKNYFKRVACLRKNKQKEQFRNSKRKKYELNKKMRPM